MASIYKKMQISVAAILTTAAALTTTIVSAQASQGLAFQRILQVWFENQDYDTVAATPGFKQLESEGILLTNYNSVTHPSEPNYVSAAGGSNFGIVSDDFYRVPSSIPTIFDLLENKGLTWRMYQEDLPVYGPGVYEDGNYVRKHNPAVIFDSVGLNATRLQNIVNSTQLDADIAANTLANWMFYTPNMLNDGHDTDAAYAANWLTQFYNSTLSNPTLQNNTLILLTFDENANYDIRNQVWTLLLGGAVPAHLKGTKDNTYYTHFSSLSTVEHNWGLGNLGQQDTNVTESNVYSFAAQALGYNNTEVSNPPMNNGYISGLLTGNSYNETSTQ